MKKFLAFTISLCMALSAFVTAFAADAPDADEVKSKISGAAEYIADFYGGFSVDDASVFYRVADGIDENSAIAAGFINDVKTNLDKNNGKIISSYGESYATYACVINALYDLGKDPANFYGYDITEPFLACDAAAAPASPNYYLPSVTALCRINSSEAAKFAETLCDSYIENYYTAGKGIDYYGFSCDNTAFFAATLAKAGAFTDKYSEIIDDAVNIINTYRTDGGFCFDPAYGTQANADSTALALMAYSCLAENEKDGLYFDETVNIYNELIKFESGKTGVFTYDGEESAAATLDALSALTAFYGLLPVNENTADSALGETPAADTADTTANQTAATESENAETAENTSKKSPATGADYIMPIAAAAASAGVLTLIAARKKIK